ELASESSTQRELASESSTQRELASESSTQREDDTLVAEPEDAAGEPLTSLEGAGVASSWADVAEAVGADEPDGLEIAFAVAGAGLDTLGAIADPFDAVMSSGAGWLIEHVWFLREPLDALAGDPEQVVAQAQTWSNVAGALRSVATDQAASGVYGWSGPAGTAYHGAVGDYARAVHDVAGQAHQLANLVLGTGAAVGTVRALIRDLIADFLTWVARMAIAALATAPITMAASTAAAIAAIALEAYRLACHLAERISRLLDMLSDAGGTAGRLVESMRHVVTELRATAPYMQHSLEPVPVGVAVEVGKQFSGTALDERPVEQTLAR
ncbi:MAG: hypothetical protein JWR58_950, partial [Pseudonocardia sp.]|nr:hypothetical protein [Pseudonocardia sp.]